MKKSYWFVSAVILCSAAMMIWLTNQPVAHKAGENGESEFEEAEKGEKPADWFMRQRAYPADNVNIAAYRAAVEQARQLRAAYPQADEVIWEEAGPNNIGGRLTAIGAHASNPSIIYAGAADGGVLKSTNGGTSWAEIFDATGVLSIGAITVDPANSNVIWVGTGEANASGDSYPGNGIYRSTNSGLTWQHLGLDYSYHIGRIAIDPTNSQRVFAAACGTLFATNPERGVYRTENGGTSWQRVLYLTDSTAAIDVVINPQNPQIVYAAMWERIRHLNQRNVGGMTSGIWRSTDGGTNWTHLTSGLPASSPTVGRIGLTISPTNPSILYAIYANHPGDLMGVWKTTNGGDSWSQTGSMSSSIYNGFGWYFGQINVDPVDPQKVFALGVYLYRSTNGGSSWSSVGGSMHVDHHALWINPSNPNLIYVGNDGGFYYTTTGGSPWTKSYDLHISQFYDIEIDYLLPQRLYGGTQDNGTLRTLTGNINDWSQIYGGDGFYAVVDYTNSNIIYAEYQYGELAKSTNGGSSFSSCLNGVSSSDRRNWNTPVFMDPLDHNKLYYGTYRLYRTTNAASNWTAISSDLTDGYTGGNIVFNTITTIAVAPTNTQVIYVGTDDGNVWVTQNGGTSWTPIYASLPDRWVTKVAVSPQDAGTVYVTLSGYRINEPLPHVYRSTSFGSSWLNISGNLPEAPVNSIIEDPENPQRLYAASDVGVYFTDNQGASWQPLGVDLPICVIMDLKLHNPTRKLVAGTHGRSMYKALVDSLTPGTAVEITLTPINPPIQVPGIGGSFSYNATVANNSPAPATFDAWIMVQQPSGAWFGPVLGPVNLTLSAGASLTRLRTQFVPSGAPTGTYVYRGYVGTYSTVKWDSSSFNFEKLPPTDAPARVGEWRNSGEEFAQEIEARFSVPAGPALQVSVQPNPFNPTTVLRFDLPAAGWVNVRVCDANGRRIEYPGGGSTPALQGWFEAGMHEITFDGSDLPSGVYLARLTAGGYQSVQKLVLMK